MGEIVNGTIVDCDQFGLLVRVPYTNTGRFIKRGYQEVVVELPDSRRISPEQRKKAWAIMTDIAVWNGDSKEEIYEAMRYDFTGHTVDTLQNKLFHLSQADITTARAYIEYLIDFCLMHGVPCREPLQNDLDDHSIAHYVYACVMNKVCCRCGKDFEHAHTKVDIHHIDRVGMGADRTQISHIGKRILPLCRTCHQEAHSIGDDAFMEKYHLQPIEVDEQIAKKYKLGKSGKGESA